MKHVRIFFMSVAATAICLAAYLTVSALILTRPEPAEAPPEKFPISPRFEFVQNYGYFIGDPISLSLVIETAADVVVDLINLPQKGDIHGLFEIRDLQLTASPGKNATQIYRAAYTLQYFGPTPYSAPFGPVEILYALPRDSGASAPVYTYKHLLTQPVVIHIARLSPLASTDAIAIKGPVDDQRTEIIWISFLFGMALISTAAGRCGLVGYRAWQRRQALTSRLPTVTEQTLQKLQHDATRLFHAPEAPDLPVGVQLDHIIRTYLQDAHQVAAFTLTPTELAGRLEGLPSAQDMVNLIERCAALKYQPPATSLIAEQNLWHDTIALFQRLRQEGLP